MHIFLRLFKGILLFCSYRFNLAMMTRFNAWTLALLDSLSTDNQVICSFLLLRTSLSLLGRFLLFHMTLVNFNLLLFKLRGRILVPILSCLSDMGFGLGDFDLIPSLWWCLIRSRIDLPFILACSNDLNESIFLLVLRSPLFFPLLESILPHFFFLLQLLLFLSWAFFFFFRSSFRWVNIFSRWLASCWPILHPVLSCLYWSSRLRSLLQRSC